MGAACLRGHLCWNVGGALPSGVRGAECVCDSCQKGIFQKDASRMGWEQKD